MAEINTVLSVKEIAKSGAAATRMPSERLETRLEAHMRLKAGPIPRTLQEVGLDD